MSRPRARPCYTEWDMPPCDDDAILSLSSIMPTLPGRLRVRPSIWPLGSEKPQGVSSGRLPFLTLDSLSVSSSGPPRP
jgi:hypothetical protein